MEHKIVPRNLVECITALFEEVPIRVLDELMCSSDFHRFNLRQYTAHWNFDHDSMLYTWFLSQGVCSLDSMYELIFQSFHRYLQDIPINFREATPSVISNDMKLVYSGFVQDVTSNESKKWYLLDSETRELWLAIMQGLEQGSYDFGAYSVYFGFSDYHDKFRVLREKLLNLEEIVNKE